MNKMKKHWKVGDRVKVHIKNTYSSPTKFGETGTITAIKRCKFADDNQDHPPGYMCNKYCKNTYKAIKWDNGNKSTLKEGCWGYGPSSTERYIIKKIPIETIKELIKN